VISVGNLVAGGTGKTPFTALVARVLRDAGFRPAVVSRGYGGRRKVDPLIVADEGGPVADVTALQAGDEPVMLGHLLEGIPVVVSRRRSDGASLAISRFGARCVVLDDGFQHLALERNLDLVLLDGEEPLGNGSLLPAGLLRESPSALARADVIVFSGGLGPRDAGGSEARGIVERWIRPDTPVFHLWSEPALIVEGSGGTPRPVGWLRGHSVVAFAGIARPERFRLNLESLGARILSFVAFPDHHPIRETEARRVLAEVKSHGPDLLITTEKDMARVEGTPQGARLRQEGLAALRVEAFLRQEDRAPFREILFAAAGGGGRNAR
jgi:tetraacyldisaccharide 4'-kinase